MSTILRGGQFAGRENRNQPYVPDCSSSTALITPSCPGGDVTRASPISVWIVAPRVMMFRVTKFGFDGFAFTVTILTFLVAEVRRSRTLANSAFRMRTFRFAPFVR